MYLFNYCFYFVVSGSGFKVRRSVFEVSGSSSLVPLSICHSYLRASIGFMLIAFRAGIKPAMAPETIKMMSALIAT